MEEEEEVKLKFFQKTGFITIFLVFLPFLGIPLMWLLTKSFGAGKKILFTILFGLWTVIVVFVLVILFLGFQSSDEVQLDAYGLPLVEEVNWGYGSIDGTPLQEKKTFTMPDIDLSFLFPSKDEDEDLEGELDEETTEGDDVAETKSEAVAEPEVETVAEPESEVVAEPEVEAVAEPEAQTETNSAPSIEIEIEIDPREVESA